MTTKEYENCIIAIEREVSIPNELREVYTKDFDIIRKHVLDAMCSENSFFNCIYKGQSLFGSYLENLKIEKPDEFDVHVVLRLPFKKSLVIVGDVQSPGFLRLDATEIRKRIMTDANQSQYLHDFDAITEAGEFGRIYVSRCNLQTWLEQILDRVFNRSANQCVRSCTGEQYKLYYNKCATAHNIKAMSEERTIKIDFVAAFNFTNKKSMKKLCFAVPKGMSGKECNDTLSFSICAPQIEKDLLIDKNNLKSCLRLMKSLRDKIGKPAYGLKSYHLKTIFLYEVDKQTSDFWNQSVGFLLIHMLGVLITYLNKRTIPFYWDKKQNLLALLDAKNTQTLVQYFSIMRQKLISFSNMRKISYHEIRDLFDFSEKY